MIHVFWYNAFMKTACFGSGCVLDKADGWTSLGENRIRSRTHGAIVESLEPRVLPYMSLNLASNNMPAPSDSRFLQVLRSIIRIFAIPMLPHKLAYV
jgi:hypothetical protein